jgi:hypothetical protein
MERWKLNRVIMKKILNSLKMILILMKEFKKKKVYRVILKRVKIVRRALKKTH